MNALRDYLQANPDVKVLGTCSICGGPVCIPATWLGDLPPTPSCGYCGALMAQNYGPIIKTVRIQTTSTTTYPPPNLNSHDQPNC